VYSPLGPLKIIPQICCLLIYIFYIPDSIACYFASAVESSTATKESFSMPPRSTSLYFSSCIEGTELLHLDWVQELPEDLDVCIAQRDFEGAVDLVQKGKRVVINISLARSVCFVPLESV